MPVQDPQGTSEGVSQILMCVCTAGDPGKKQILIQYVGGEGAESSFQTLW